ncbi:MAG: excinuclease ABC subunit UvrA [Armatimonadetes bacterium]|nr:excinuclease ABC subunit UvrA [Armatimonadota bacterium]
MDGPAERRSTIAVHGARVHNLKNVTVEIPRDKLVVVTGLSGSGKSSLAFDTIYAEGQRRYMESLSTYARRFVAQVAKPDLDFIYGLSPVISIAQKTIGHNPRSTVGTLTDIGSYLNLLFATIASAECPFCAGPIPIRTTPQLLDDLLGFGPGTLVELRAPVWPIYGENLDVLFTEIRKKGYRRLLIDGREVDLSDELELDETAIGRMEVIIDRVELRPGREKELATSLRNALLVGDPYVSVHLPGRDDCTWGCPEHKLVVGDLQPSFFMFNEPASACRTCLGLGTHLQVHPDLLVPDKSRSINGGCFIRDAFFPTPDNWAGRMAYSLSQHYGFSLDTPFAELPPDIVDLLLYGSHGHKFTLLLPPDANPKNTGGWMRMIGKPIGFDGVARQIESHYRHYRQQEVAKTWMEGWLTKVMVEHRCPDCQGSRLKPSRLRFRVQGRTIHEIGEINFDELQEFLAGITIEGAQRSAGEHVLREIRGRLDLLLGIGLDYLNFNRRSSTLSGGESQRIRLSTQIGSGLMGMLYVLDEPSIGLHPKDNAKMIATLRHLRDLGNTVIVVEHDEDTIRAADHLVEMGPGPGLHGGEVVAQGSLADLLACPASPTGRFFGGRESIPLPAKRRKPTGKQLVIRGARENNLRSIDVAIPLGQLVCVTGASGSGKSTLVNEILAKRLHNALVDSRMLYGEHDAIEGLEHVSRLTNIDQSPIGRNSRSNPATYIGFYDDIRKLFAATDLARERGYTAGRFSFNVAEGRCAECSGEGNITTKLYFMPDVETVCESCKGQRYNPETLEVTYRGKTIADVLDMPVEEGCGFFADQRRIATRIDVLNQLGLGYLTLGQSSTTLSGGEAQRVKLAAELSKLRRGDHVLYILDEPTTGLHLADIARLLDCLNRLVAAGHTVLVIEHHLDVIKTADHVIDLGPEGGHSGGEVVVVGTPEEVAACERSYTGRYLRRVLANGAG